MDLREGAKGAEPPPNVKLYPEYSGKGVMIDDHGIASSGNFFDLLHHGLHGTIVRRHEESIELKQALRLLRTLCHDRRFSEGKSNKVILIGNGGSSAVASHIATDYSKNGGIRAIALNDAPLLTCLANDYGSDEIWAKQLEFYALPGDLVIIVSTSGKSPNILRAAEQAFEMGMTLVTFSGMMPSNMLRRRGLLSFWVPCKDYGLVEIAHLALLHSVVSVMGEM